jgi:hypothetical protein
MYIRPVRQNRQAYGRSVCRRSLGRSHGDTMMSPLAPPASRPASAW